MRLFNLFLRRAGVQAAPIRVPSRVSRLTVVCPHNVLADVRKQIYLGFEAAGLRVSAVSVDGARQQGLARACVTVNRSEEHTSELQSLMRTSYAVFCLKKQNSSRQSLHTEYSQTTT